MQTFYNEINTQAVKWLRQLIEKRQISTGTVDNRSIDNIKPFELASYTRCHFFAGIGGWDYALKLAGWPNDVQIWTGSCPCQPFSTSGKRNGFADDRHLWPSWFWLIKQCRPHVIFGEQVAGKLGLEWLDIVSTDLEGIGYAIGSITLPSCSVGAPHLRQRLFWVAYANGDGWEKGGRKKILDKENSTVGLQETIYSLDSCEWSGDKVRSISFPDGSHRPIESSIIPLANGIPARVVRLRGYGNAIVPQLASEFIKAAMSKIFQLES